LAGAAAITMKTLRTKTLGKLNDILAKLVALVVREEGDATASLTTTVKNCSRPTGLKTEQKPAVGGDCRLWLACAELFPEHAKLHHPDAFRGVPLQCATEFQDLIGWMAQAKDSKDAAVIADGRSEIVRKAVREKMTSAVGDSEFIELWLVYDMETSLNTDVRNPKRKLAWSGANTEIIFAMPPQAGKGGKARKIIARDVYANSGEATNCCRSYTGVPFRNLAEIPRMTKDTKVKILGASAVGDMGKDRVAKEIDEKGHPLFWGEWKPVHYYARLMKDFGATEVMDLTPGSGAAAIGALYQGIPYMAVCENEAQKEWLWTLLQKLFLAIVANKTVEVDAEVTKNVTMYLQRTVEAAKQYLPKGTPSAFGDSFTGDNDSDEDE